MPGVAGLSGRGRAARQLPGGGHADTTALLSANECAWRAETSRPLERDPGAVGGRGQAATGLGAIGGEAGPAHTPHPGTAGLPPSRADHAAGSVPSDMHTRAGRSPGLGPPTDHLPRQPLLALLTAKRPGPE